jgi:hypothetical protein
MGILKDVHLASKDLSQEFSDSWLPKGILYVIWIIVFFIYFVIIKFIIINSFNFIYKLFKRGKYESR